MARPPRNPTERVLSPALLARAYGFLGILEATGAMVAFGWVLHRAGWRWGQPLGPDEPLYLTATTACLSAIVVAQVANLLECRSARRSAFAPPAPGRFVLAGIAAELALLLVVIYAPIGQRLIGTAPLDLATWSATLPGFLLLLGAEESRKAALARSRHAAAGVAECSP